MKISLMGNFCWPTRGRSRLHYCDYLVVEAIAMNRVVYCVKKFCSLPRDKIGARHLSFLQGLIRIKRVAQKIGVAG